VQFRILQDSCVSQKCVLEHIFLLACFSYQRGGGFAAFTARNRRAGDALLSGPCRLYGKENLRKTGRTTKACMVWMNAQMLRARALLGALGLWCKVLAKLAYTHVCNMFGEFAHLAIMTEVSLRWGRVTRRHPHLQNFIDALARRVF
jgi:hypothetical protein